MKMMTLKPRGYSIKNALLHTRISAVKTNKVSRQQLLGKLLILSRHLPTCGVCHNRNAGLVDALRICPRVLPSPQRCESRPPCADTDTGKGAAGDPVGWQQSCRLPDVAEDHLAVLLKRQPRQVGSQTSSHTPHPGGFRSPAPAHLGPDSPCAIIRRGQSRSAGQALNNQGASTMKLTTMQNCMPGTTKSLRRTPRKPALAALQRRDGIRAGHGMARHRQAGVTGKQPSVHPFSSAHASAPLGN